ncbi:MAG: hypothetical protein ABI874_00850 [Chloroflexota bacterium]
MATPYVQSVIDRHKPFVVLTSLGFALLYAELGLFAHHAWRARGDDEAAIIIGAAFALTFAAFVASFVPAKSFTVAGGEQQASLVLPELTLQMGKGAGLVLLASVVCFIMYLYLVAFDLVAATTLVNNLYVFTLVGAGLLHVVVSYVRYGALLYAVKQDSYVKVLVVSGGLGLLIAASFVFLLSLDINWANAVPAAQRGLLGLHVYARDLYFFTLVLAVYGWHARWMADH